MLSALVLSHMDSEEFTVEPLNIFIRDKLYCHGTVDNYHIKSGLLMMQLLCMCSRG